MWIAGSFVTLKATPKDIDVVIFVSADLFGRSIQQLLRLKQDVESDIDCYFVEEFPEGHAKFEIGKADELTWYYFFNTDRRNRKKGIVEILVEYGNQ